MTRIDKTVIFVDAYAQRPYTPETIDQAHLGGSERSAMYLAEGLASSKRARVVYFQQHIQKSYKSSNGVIYENISRIAHENPDHAIIVRTIKLLAPVRKMLASSKLYLVLDDLDQYCDLGNYPLNIDFTIICKSNWHKDHIDNALGENKIKAQIVSIYNPIPGIPDIDDANLSRNPDKLLFASSPHKGLEHALQLFAKLNTDIPSLQLHVANPGYLMARLRKHKNVHDLGMLPYKQLRKEMATALCLFHPNYTYPETFGCVFAEANMAGTPVLAHAHGSAREVLLVSHKQKIANAVIDTRNYDSVLSTICAWRNNKALDLSCPAQFRQKNVVKQWLNLLNI